MGKLVDMLEEASRGAAPPMGFRAAQRTRKVPPILLLGCAPAGDEPPATKIAEAGLHAAILTANANTKKPELDRSVKALGEMPWGTWRDQVVASAEKDSS